MNAIPRAPSTALIRVLLVDDDPLDHRVVIDLLDSIPCLRFTIETARSLAEGRELLGTTRFDVCLLDLRLPDGDGLDLMASADALGLMMPFVILTGYPSIDLDQRALSLGAGAFLEKDKLDPATLGRTVRYAVHHRKVMAGLARQAFLDEGTGLISTGLFRERLERALAFARRHDREVAVMMIDLAFDPTIDADAALTDAALAAVGRRLAGQLRETDSIARLSDRRLGLLIENLYGLHQAAAVAGRALRLLRNEIDVDGQNLTLAPSIGIAHFPREAGDGQALLRQAEAAMRRAVAEGGACCRFGSERVDVEAREIMIEDKAFGIAFERRQLRLGLYPEVSLGGRFTGLAAEILWQHPDRGWLPAAPTLSDTDDPALIQGIADWSLASAAEQILSWQREGLTLRRLSLAMPFRRPPALSLLEQAVGEQIKSRQVPPARIELALQESLLLHDRRRGSADLVTLRKTGVRLALDDFGTGDTAIQHLRHDLLNGARLAASLCRDLEVGERTAKLTRALIGLGRHLQWEVTAKVSGDRQQISHLKRFGANALQLSADLPSMSAEAATIWLRRLVGSAERSGESQPGPSPETLVPGLSHRHRRGANAPTPPDQKQ